MMALWRLTAVITRGPNLTTSGRVRASLNGFTCMPSPSTATAARRLVDRQLMAWYPAQPSGSPQTCSQWHAATLVLLSMACVFGVYNLLALSVGIIEC